MCLKKGNAPEDCKVLCTVPIDKGKGIDGRISTIRELSSSISRVDAIYTDGQLRYLCCESFQKYIERRKASH